MFRFKNNLVLAITLPLLLAGCGSLGSRATPAPVEEPGQVDKPEERITVAPIPATRIAPPEKTSPAPAAASPQSGSALKKLQLAALSQERSGQYTQSAATLERALRISPSDATLWHQLAEVRLKQQKWRLAINMAAKSNALAASQPALQRKNWLVMATAHHALGETSKGKAAFERARSE